MLEAGSASETESGEEFFDAEDITPKSRGHSLKKRTSEAPQITISRAPQRPESLTFDFEDEHARAAKEILPDEITRELEALSQVDDDRSSRIAKLEKLRRKGEFDSEEEDNGDLGEPSQVASKQEPKPKVVHPESTESSVEGIYLSGVRQSHPFKVIEPEPDRRSVCSETRSSHGRASALHDPSSRADSLAKISTNAHPGDDILPYNVPDIVSSLQHKPNVDYEVTHAAMAPPNRPPRRSKKKSTETLPSSDMTEAVEPPVRRQAYTSPLFSKPTHHCTTSTPRLHVFNDPLPNPVSTVASLTRDLEDTLHSLDLQAAMRGQYVVKPQDDENSRGESSFQDFQRSFLASSSIEEEPETIAPLKTPKEDSLERQQQGAAAAKFPSSSDRKSLKSNNGGSGGRRSSSSVPLTNVPVNTQSLGSNYASATSGSSSGGKRSLHSGGSMDSSAARDFSGLTKQMNMFLRTRSDSGKKLNDEDILRQIKVKNLDTGELVDLVEAEDQLPASVNPLSLHIMRLTSEYVSGDRSNVRSHDSDTESLMSAASSYTLGGKKKKNSVKKFFGSVAKKTTDAAKSLSIESNRKKPKEHSLVVEKDVEKIGRLATEIKRSEGVPQPSRDGKSAVFKRIQAHRSGPFDFEGIKFAQELSSTHLGPIWCMKFSQCGQLLATAGQDTTLTIWVLKNSYNYFADMRSRYNADNSKSSPTNSYENVISDLASEDKSHQVFMDVPFCQYRGHTSDLLDVSWSKNYFILTSSMDKTVRLWHISRRECLCCFQHIDFVTAICFHPRNDQFFLSGSLDGKLRLWNIPDKKVALWNEVDGASKLITTANFIQNGKFAVVGTYDGRVIFYGTDLKYHTMIHVRSARGKNAQGRKVTGIEPMPGEDKILVTSNDSRIRLYDLRDLSLSCKYKGYMNGSSQIRASFSHDGKYISAGSENQCVFLWRTNYEPSNLTVRKDRNNYYEAIKAHNAVVTCSVFAPSPQLVFDQLDQNTTSDTTFEERKNESKLNSTSSFKKDKPKENNKNPGPGYVVISGDYDGEIKVFYNAVKPKHSSLPQ